MDASAPIDHASPLDSPTDHSALLRVLVWILSVAALLFIVVRSGVKWTLTKKGTFDDVLISVAMAFCIASGVCLTIATNNGFGSKDAQPDEQTILLTQKLVLSFNVLFYWSMCFSKLSVIYLVRNLSPATNHRRIAMGVAVVIGAWTLMATFGLIFQCKPLGWEFLNGQCINRAAFYTWLIVLDLVIELILVLQPILLAWQLKIGRAQRFTISLCFLGRSLVAGLLIAQIAIIWSRLSDDIFYDFGFVLTTILIQSFSITTASIPYLRPFFLSLQIGALGAIEVGHPMQRASVFASRIKSTRTTKDRSGFASAQDPESKRNSRWRFERLSAEDLARAFQPADAPTSKGEVNVVTRPANDSGSQTPSNGGIEQTFEVTVQIETLPPAPGTAK